MPELSKIDFHYRYNRTDRSSFNIGIQVYECDECSGYPFRSKCIKAKEGHHLGIQ
jgi:transposase